MSTQKKTLQTMTLNELKVEKKRLRAEYHQPYNRRMNGKPTAEAFDKYGKQIYEIEGEIRKRLLAKGEEWEK